MQFGFILLDCVGLLRNLFQRSSHFVVKAVGRRFKRQGFFQIGNRLFWKMLLKVVIAIAAIAIIVLLASGALLIIQSIHHMTR